MKYKCDRCLKEFTQKSNFDVHMNRKKTCLMINKDDFTSKTINPPKLLPNPPKLLPNPPKLLPNPPKLLPNPPKLLPNHPKDLICININNSDNFKSYICKKCNLIFTRSDNLKRHINKSCKIIEDANIEEIIDDKIEKIVDEKTEIKIEIINIKNKLNNLMEENKHLKKQLVKSFKGRNNITNNQIIQNQQNNNIQIKMVSFGDEDINKLTEDEIHSILTSKSKAFINLIKAIHLNERLPEYNNLLINNLRSDYCSIIEDNKLVIKNKNKTLTYLIDMRLSDLRDLINQYKTNKKLPKKDLEFLASVFELLKTMNLEDEDIDGNIIKPEKIRLKDIKELYKELAYMFYDNRDFVTKNITKVSEEIIKYLDV
jgi:hypothetical protein